MGSTSGARLKNAFSWTADPKLVFKFKSRCYASKWISDTEIEASCPYEGDDFRSEVPARVTRVAPGQWRLQQSGLPTVVGIETRGQTAPFDETVTAAEFRPGMECIWSELYCPERNEGLSESGYARLGR